MAVCLIACGDGEEPVAFDDFSREAVNAICDWGVRCHHVPSRVACERLLDPKDYDASRARDSIEAGLSVYDIDMATRCLATTRDGFCLHVPFSDPSCARVFVGTRAAGESCTSVRECQSGRCTISECPGQCCVGVCEAAADVGEAPALASVGEACQNHGDCEEGSYCETDRHCTRFPDEPGERCLIGCARGDLYCDIESFTCQRFGAYGEACDPAVPGALPCDPAWAVCDGVCRPRPGLGERCNDSDRLCIPALRCGDDGVCGERAPVGAPCESSKDCANQCDLSASTCQLYSSCEL